MSGQAKQFLAPLLPGDTQDETVGCRHTNPDICGKNCMPDVCAFVREDGMCLSPPATWPKQFRKLAESRNNESEDG